MASSAAKKAETTRKRPSAETRTTKRNVRPRMLVDDISAILLISPNATELCEFYKATLGLPLKEEKHSRRPLHYGYTLSDVHFAIHNADSDWPGVPGNNSQSPVITFSTSNLKAIAKRLAAKGVSAIGPTDHGFGKVISFQDPDGNRVSIIEYGSEYW